jgi:phosphinothricin tripeptide acetyl hydrolase
MSIEQRDKMVAMMRGRPRDADPLARRAGFDAFASRLWPDFILPPTVETAPGLAARWVGPAAQRGAPLLLWLHGGGFTLASSASHAPMLAEIALGAGLPALLPDYALVPENRFPAGLDDAGRLLDWLEGEGWPIDRIAIGGDSAGGNLAVAAVQDRLRAGRSVPRACWLMSPYLDLTHAGGSFCDRRARDPFVDPDDGTGSNYRGAADARDPRVSPLFGPVEGFPETLIQVGSEEVLYDDSRAFARRLWDSGIAATFQEWDGMIHIFQFTANALDEGRAALQQGINFLRRTLA